MAQASHIPLRAVGWRAFLAAILVAVVIATGAAYAIGFTGELERQLLDPSVTPWLRGQVLEHTAALSRALSAAQAISVAALSLVASALFALAWLVRARLVEPIEALRQATEQAADGALFQPIWGIERKDEIGALARAADRLRRRAAAGAPDAALAQGREVHVVLEGKASRLFDRMMGRLGLGATRLESDLEGITASMAKVRDRMEVACQDAAAAGKSAIETAALTRSDALHFSKDIQSALEDAGARSGLANVSRRLLEAAERLERAASAQSTAPGYAHVTNDDGAESADEASAIGAALRSLTMGRPESEPTSILSGLTASLEALESFAKQRAKLNEDEATILTATLIDAIDRLNDVASRLSETADLTKARVSA